ncbi:DOPA 4,5-dioxygenase family protein [Rhizobium mesoamericanum]|uniref:DOPA 4,5-dioxygenase family protein n=1 Tax=Rhizobium mesoamericanum TaxID=1079800 RepID=UPI00042147B0|nr:DOPA 4,5-dioxygenase family protein [Rhizobium mesoamericanum]
MSKDDLPLKLDRIESYHAHVYFDGSEQRETAELLREEIAERFSVLLGRWHDRPVGPHALAMYQVAFLPVEFPRLVPWLMVNRRGLTILIHPNTGEPKSDHLERALWLGAVLEIDTAPLSDHEDSEVEIVPNTRPTVSP